MTILGVGWSTSFFLEMTSKGPVAQRHLFTLSLRLYPHSKGTGALRRAAAQGAHRFDV